MYVYAVVTINFKDIKEPCVLLSLMTEWIKLTCFVTCKSASPTQGTTKGTPYFFN